MLIVANWKAYVESREEAKKLLATAKRLSSTRRVRIVLAPPAPYLGMLAPGNRSRVLFAAQDISDTTVGNATGEVTGAALRNIGATYVLVGHSERRAKGETDTVVAEKIKRALVNGLIPILCIGEKQRDEDAQYLGELKQQLTSVFSTLSPKERLGVVIAYEPVWAIGKHAESAISSQDLAEMVLYIRKVLSEYLPGKSATKATILYGAAVEPANIRGLAGGSGVDGFLVGHASVDPGMFPALVKALA
ncbi:MAG TPA: triose-phosphate isomerase [Candidatus Paceibacterota bacterium]|nr:triose-phosphate isomerase [Candidatus Paceibacterota bacterium]